MAKHDAKLSSFISFLLPSLVSTCTVLATTTYTHVYYSTRIWGYNVYCCTALALSIRYFLLLNYSALSITILLSSFPSTDIPELLSAFPSFSFLSNPSPKIKVTFTLPSYYLTASIAVCDMALKVVLALYFL